MAKRVAQMGGTASQVAAYVGIAKQLVVDTTNYRVHVMNGTTAGGIRLARFDEIPAATDLSGYLLKTDASSLYLGKTATAEAAKKDGSGNVITSTYATQTTANAKIAKSGDRGSLAGYETLTSTASAVTITDGSPDDQAVTGAVAVTVSNGTAGKVWTKTVGITNESATISLGSSWYWVGGKAPTVAANSILVLKWYGTFGVANLILTA